MLIATRGTTHKTTYLERGIDARLSKATCEREYRGRLKMLERVLELPDAAIEAPFYDDGCPLDRLALPHQQAQGGISTAAAGFSFCSSSWEFLRGCTCCPCQPQ